jgi:hypothetical protein
MLFESEIWDLQSSLVFQDVAVPLLGDVAMMAVNHAEN